MLLDCRVGMLQAEGQIVSELSLVSLIAIVHLCA